ncbi:MAG: hypothetical protein ABEI52_10015 [Halobacteriaceae archaeon]
MSDNRTLKAFRWLMLVTSIALLALALGKVLLMPSPAPVEIVGQVLGVVGAVTMVAVAVNLVQTKPGELEEDAIPAIVVAILGGMTGFLLVTSSANPDHLLQVGGVIVGAMGITGAILLYIGTR